MAAAGEVKRKLIEILPDLELPSGFSNPKLVSKGNLVLEGEGEIKDLISCLEKQDMQEIFMKGCMCVIHQRSVVRQDGWMFLDKVLVVLVMVIMLI